MKHRLSIMLICFCGLAVSAGTTELYYTNRTFTPVTFNLQGTVTVYQLSTESEKLTDIVKGTNITINTNETYAIEKQAVALSYVSSTDAWNAALQYECAEVRYTGTFDNVGWVRGTKLHKGEWGAYLWTLQNRIVFLSSQTNWWISPSNGVRVAISNVLVGSLGDYPPMADTNDIGPSINTNFPGEGDGDERAYQVDITNVFYRLIIPSIWITPRTAYAKVGGSNVEYEVTGTNISTNGVTWTITPDGLTSGAVIQVSNDWHYAGVTPGTVATNYLIRATDVDNTNFYDEVPFVVSALSIDMVPDFNHDREINASDKSLLMANGPFRFWINDDNDNGDVANGNSDLPGWGTSYADYYNDHVDGRRDLLDFFPLWLDLNETLNLLPPSDTVQYKLKQADAAVNVIYTDLTKGQAGSFLTTSNKIYGSSLDQNSYAADTIKITSGGVALSTNFLNKIKDDATKGVLMVEGRKAKTSPLVLEIWNDGKKICQKEMPLSISGVEKMYRWINLRPGHENESRTTPPDNYPDSLCPNDKNVFFIHGFMVTADEARGRNAEIFKRLYRSGSRAKFWGMTWESDSGWINALHYQECAASALNTVASNFYSQVNVVSGTKIILAHSLGNMVVSGAIQDYGLSVSNYFMLNAAVARECYDPAAFNDATNGNYMLHSDWLGYNSNTWCSTWSRLFSSPDDRAKLTWKDRFPSVLSVAFNFYSSGDQLFEVYPGTPSPFSGGIPFNLQQYAWQKQEMFKGRTAFGGTLWAGWGFSGGYTVEQANNATPDNLRTNAVFLHQPATMFSSNITTQAVNDILAQGVPALSHAGGENNIEGVIFNYNANVGTHKPNGWGRNDYKYGTRWLHSDLVDMAYYYTYDLFNQIVARGGLQ